MKPIKVLLSLIVVVAVLFASTSFVNAIGFEAEKAYESVFVIYSGNSLGSGFAVGENCIVTNAHVIGDPQSITVATYGGQEYRAAVLGINEQEDIAVLTVTDATFPYLEVADLSQMRTGDDIYAIGAPRGMAYTLTKGGISAKERAVGNQTYIQIDAAINQGNSGGPLLNDAGQVLGMNTLKMTDTEGIGLAIPISRVCDYLRGLQLPLDAKGNVEGAVSLPEGEHFPDSGAHPKDENDTDGYHNYTPSRDLSLGVTMLFLMSMAGNVVLLVLLIKEKKKQAVKPYDPSERTDFDIDILE